MSVATPAAGILLLDKPLGLSSNRALQTVKRLLGADKAGHVGSLDPLATGMLPICLGEATKIAGEILSGRKQYRFAVTLGSRTATGDAEGEVVETLPVPRIEPALITETLRLFLGAQQQTPPMYSAIKQQGQPLYRLARAGKEVERASRQIEIFALTSGSFDGTVLELEATCSKGTYIRVLAEDIARALGTCGHVTRLRRTWVEPFETEPMQTLEEVERSPRLLPPDRGVPHLPRLELSAAEALRLRQGQALCWPEAGARFGATSPASSASGPASSAGGEGAHPPGLARLYDDTGRFFGLGTLAGGTLRPRRLWSNSACG